MKKLIISAFVVFMGLTASKSYGQVSRIPYYDNINFGTSFFRIAETNDNSDFYVVDLSKLGSAFERSYFVSFTYNDSRIVRIDAGNENIAWFRAKKVFTQTEIAQLFESLKQQAAAMAGTMTEFQKNEWLNRNGK